MNAAGTASRLNAGIQAACPIVDMRIGVYGDSTTVSFTPSAGATANQITAAQAFINAFNWNSSVDANAFQSAQEPLLTNLLGSVTSALADIDAYLLIADSATAVQVRTEVKALVQRQRAIINALSRIANSFLP